MFLKKIENFDVILALKIRNYLVSQRVEMYSNGFREKIAFLRLFCIILGYQFSPQFMKFFTHDFTN